jgi:EAL domain-containing protein (putative c-di-GMP-specific phosphodiesterase class I)
MALFTESPKKECTDKEYPKLFISYSQTDDRHKDWVVDLAKRLLKDGVEVIMDRWDLKYGHEMYVFMEQMVTDPTVDKVLIVCDSLYKKKADGRIGGVGNEVELMVNCIANDTTQEKFFALACEKNEDGNGCIPNYLSSRFYIDFSDAEDFELNYDRLLFFVHGREYHKKPARGQIPERLTNGEDRQPSRERPSPKRDNISAQPTPFGDVLNLIYGNAKKFKAAKGWLSGVGPSAEDNSGTLSVQPDKLYSDVSLVSSCFEQSEVLLESILNGLARLDSSSFTTKDYLKAICDAFNANSCTYIENMEVFHTSKRGKVSVRQIQTLREEYSELFGQNLALVFNASRSIFKNNSAYVPLIFDTSVSEGQVAGLLINGIDKAVNIDASFQIVLSSIYEKTNVFSDSPAADEIRMHVYDNFKTVYNFVSDEMYEHRYALFNQQLSSVDVYFEPIIQFSASGKSFNIIGFEALARVDGLVPGWLFKAAELWGIRFQTQLDIYILRTALTKYLDQLVKSKRRSFSKLMMLTVNLYSSTILRPGYRTELYKILEELKFPGDKLVLELSEKAVIRAGDNEDETLEAFISAKEELKEKRVQIAIDDFGAGYSSLLRVQKIMPDFVKVDREVLLYQPAFAAEMIAQLVSTKDASHNRLFRVIVEGLDEEVEENITLSTLVNDLEVDYIQGHALAMASHDVPDRLDKAKHDEIKQKLGW